jgi:hypothetical protein
MDSAARTRGIEEAKGSRSHAKHCMLATLRENPTLPTALVFAASQSKGSRHAIIYGDVWVLDIRRRNLLQTF